MKVLAMCTIATCTILALGERTAPAQAGGAPPAQMAQLRVGAARVDITPSDLTNLNPFGGSWSGVHDPIYARILVVDDGVTKAAIVATDLIEVGDTTEVRERIQRELGIPKEHITVTASHDHSAPRAGSVTPGGIAHGATAESLSYTKTLYDKVFAGTQQAVAAMQPALFGMSTGDVNININRDAYTLGKGYSQGYNPSGVSDKTLWVLKFESPSGEPIALLLNYAVHSTATLGSGMLSGDLGGETSRLVERRLGGKAVVLYTMGAAGDQNSRYNGWQPVANGGVGAVGPGGGAPAGGSGGPGNGGPGNGPGPGSGGPGNGPGGGPGAGGGPGSGGGPGKPAPPTPEQIADTFDANHAQAFMLAAEAVRVAANMKDLTSAVRIHAAERIITCPVKQGTNNTGNIVQKDVPAMPLHLGLLQLNDVALTAVSGEVVTNIYWHLKKSSPLTNTIMLTIANDRAGYIADDKTYDSPTFEVNGTPFARGCAENGIVDNLVEMMAQGK